jgi:hypothetical protein
MMPSTLHTVEGLSMARRDGGPVPGLFDERIVYTALDAIDQAIEQALTARTEIQQRWQLNQLVACCSPCPPTASASTTACGS